MPAGLYNIVCEQGATLRRTFTWKDKHGVPIPLTDYDARMHVRSTYDSDDLVLDLTAGNNGVVLTPAQGKVELVVEAVVTAALVPGDYLYDLELESPGGDVKRLLQGTFKVTPEVTK